MKRRDFLVNSAAVFSGCTLFSGCKKEETASKIEGGVVRKKFKDTETPLLGFGGSRYPVDNKNEIDMAELDKMVEYAMNHGVNLFDTAYFYINHKSETALGEILKKYPRKNYMLSDKLPLYKIKTKDDVRKVFNEQLKKCGVDYFDFYMPHGINTDNYEAYKNAEVHKELLKLKKEGKIKYLGFSFHGTLEMLQEIVDEKKWDCCQLQLNYFDWKNMKGESQYETVKKAGIPIIIMEPLRGGKLVHLPDEAGDALKKKYPDMTPSELGLRWAASIDNVITVLSGMSNIEQVKQNVKVFENFKVMTKDENKTAQKIASIIQSQGKISCVACKNCLNICPRGINIPAIFAAYNHYNILQNKAMFAFYYETLTEKEKAYNCTKCGLCAKNCPQKLNIPDLIAQVQKEYDSAKVR